jgi:VanZ family protein
MFYEIGGSGLQKTDMKKNILRKIPAIAVMAAITILSALPGDNQLLNSFELHDKLKHIIAYFVLGLSLCLWIPSKKWLTKPIIYGVIIVVACTVFGILDEFHQSFVPGRSGNDLGDIAANFIGGLFSPFMYFAAIKFRDSRYLQPET